MPLSPAPTSIPIGSPVIVAKPQHSVASANEERKEEENRIEVTVIGSGKGRRVLFWITTGTLWIVASLCLAAIVSFAATVAIGMRSEFYASDIKARYERLVGASGSQLVRELRAPDSVNREAPIVYQTATGEITQRLQPYVIWSYYAHPRLCRCFPLRVFIDDHTGTITRIKTPFE